MGSDQTPNGGAIVNYTVKELLADMDTRHSGALHSIEGKVDELGRRVGALEAADQTAVQVKVATTKQRASFTGGISRSAGAMLALAMLASNGLAAYAAFH